MKNKVLVQANFKARHEAFPAQDYSASEQAELLRGVSVIAQYFKDWKINAYNRSVQVIKASSLLPEFPQEELNYSIFPKEFSYTLAILNGVNILQNLNKKNSTVFLLNDSGEAYWTNDKNKAKSPMAMAAIVDIKGGKRSLKVKSSDVANYILALVEFLKATDGIKNTESFILKNKSDGDSTPAKEIIKARKMIGNLAVALGNFLTHKMQGDDGGFYSEFDRKRLRVNKKSKRKLANQIIIMQALMSLSNHFKVNIYNWAAIDAYYFMNNNLWSTRSDFYINAEEGTVKRLNLLEASELLKTLRQMTLHLSGSELQQLQRLSRTWESRFRGLINF